MKKIEVFEGDSLLDAPNPSPVRAPICAFHGHIDGQPLAVPLDEDLLSRHMVFLGGIGTGKTNAIIQVMHQIRKSLTRDDVMVIFDTKGDFHKHFYRPGDIVISNDATATGPQGPDYWNLFAEVEQNDRMEENIQEIARALFHKKLERTNQPFFPNAAKDLFMSIMMHFVRNRDTLQGDNRALRAFLNQANGTAIRAILEQHADLKAMISYIADDRSPQTQGVLSELQQACREVLIGNFARSGTLSMRNLVRQKGGRIVFIEYDLGIGSMLAPIYSLLFDLAIKEALCRAKSDGNVYFVADEFRLLPYLEHVDDAVNFGRSLGVKFMIGLQNVEQVYEGYGEQRARSILSGFLTSVAFRVNDETTRHFIKGIHGTNRKREMYTASVQGRGIIENVRDANVVEDWDVSALAIGEAIIGLPGRMPFRFQFARVPNI